MYVTEAQLAASDGSSLVGFVQPGTGAQTRTVEDKLHESVSSRGLHDPSGRARRGGR